MKTLTIAANLKHAALDAETAYIGGGSFDPLELFEAAGQLEAVPELVAALTEAETYLHSVIAIAPNDVADNVLQTIRAAIAKAEGMQ